MTDYISREAAKEEACERCVGQCYCDKPELCSVMAAIDAIHAADVRPVVRGKWIGNKRHQSCSECHMTYCVPDGQDGELDMTAYHYCPNCGAKMEES